MNNIILIGMPGVGKSTVGVILAKLTGRSFIDTDLVIQGKTGMLLKDIIAERGIDGFISLENSVCASLDAENAVIATGGSVVYGEDAMKHLRSIGTVIYLKHDVSVLKKRLSDLKGRGVILREGQTLDSLFEERAPLYERYAHAVADLSDGSIEDNVNIILSLLA